MEICHHDWQSLLDKVNAILIQGASMSAELDRLTTEVTETKTAVGSALTLISGMADQIRALSDNPAALNALADELDAQQAAIAVAIVANTPAAPPA